GRDAVRDRLREVLQDFRQELLAPNGFAATDETALADELEKRLQARFTERHQLRTQRVINATGVVLHTNLGRAPLSEAALAAIREVASGYCNLEYDLTTGKRGKRGTGLETMLRDLLGCEAVAVVNNCAAAVWLVLNALGEGGEVIISRGELVEIGGSFRIPDVIAKSGARMREVGTTNRTRLSDYETAINENTRVILRAHPSNYRIVGFTEKPALSELVALAEKHHLPFFEDLGSGSLIDLAPLGIRDEPTVSHSLAAGVPILAFSGDKLLGGPQCGLIVGAARYVKQVKANPLMRALRVDKLAYAALETTVAAYANGTASQVVPALAALHATAEQLRQRAEAFAQKARVTLPESFTFTLLPGASMVGGGSAPDVQLPTTLVQVTHARWSAMNWKSVCARCNPRSLRASPTISWRLIYEPSQRRKSKS
ncbi:MAG: L-seryl-tRNA(Sec) selenium transferase, partial [Acidobacteria bacterium]|nr:L-seryl-tRNA(Sec) selenium transferase [Acidobacteriota bacterium]